MSDKDFGKKEIEQIELEPFLEAYEWVTGEALTIMERGESPDFICGRPNAGEIGLELTKLTRDPRDKFWEAILDRKEQMDPYEALEYIQNLIKKKGKARIARYSSRVRETILVLQFVDGSVDSLKLF